VGKLHEKTILDVLGLRESFGEIQIGDTVRIKTTGYIGRVKAIGRYGLLDIQGCLRVYSPAEVEIVDKKITA